MSDQRLKDIEYIRKATEVAARSQASGAHPFGAILVGPDGDVLLEEFNGFPTDGDPGHAETNLARAAARKFSVEFLEVCTLYTSVEPCCMCTGSIYWAGIGAIVFGTTEHALGEITGDHPENMTMDLPCRTVIASGRRNIDVRGPFEELEAEILDSHRQYWA